MRPLKEVEGPMVESRPQQDTRLSLGQGAGVIEDSSFVEEPIIESPIETVSDKAIEGVEGPVVESTVEAVTDKAVGEVEEVADKVDKVVEKAKKPSSNRSSRLWRSKRRNFSSEAAARHSIVFRPRRY